MNLASSLWLVSPEVFLSVSSLILLLVAAWSQERAARLITILSVAALFGASGSL
jgi:NADH-quinone oxidoreductase subunit N